MQIDIRELNPLENAKKIHTKLRNRLILLCLIGLGATGILVYDVVMKSLPILPVLGFTAFGFALGVLIFKRIARFTWDEEREVVSVGRFDLATVTVLLVYIAYRIAIHIVLEVNYHNAVLVSGFSLATLVGGMIGRLLGTQWIIAKMHRENTV